jgi:hypothetical protein
VLILALAKLPDNRARELKVNCEGLDEFERAPRLSASASVIRVPADMGVVAYLAREHIAEEEGRFDDGEIVAYLNPAGPLAKCTSRVIERPIEAAGPLLYSAVKLHRVEVKRLVMKFYEGVVERLEALERHDARQQECCRLAERA